MSVSKKKPKSFRLSPECCRLLLAWSKDRGRPMLAYIEERAMLEGEKLEVYEELSIDYKEGEENNDK